MRGRRSKLLGVVGILAVTACSSDSDVARDDDPAVEAVPVSGTAACVLESYDDELVEGALAVSELFVCELQLSDPRVSGTERLPVETRLSVDSGTWTVEDGVLESSGGSWSGSGRGVVTFADILPEAEGVEGPVNFGEMEYLGEGEYEGLRFHYYFSGTNAVEGIAGWIEPVTGQ